MYNDDTDLLFPPRAIPNLRDLRGIDWQTLIDEVTIAEPTHIQRLAFVMLMVRMGGCISCHADSYRAMRGCTHCSQQTIRRFRGSDKELVDLFEKTYEEIDAYLNTGKEISQ
jgi:hypothetical protein